jgi:hypothetical protein
LSDISLAKFDIEKKLDSELETSKKLSFDLKDLGLRYGKQSLLLKEAQGELEYV